MKQYLDIVRNVLDKGEWKGNRTGIRTLTTFGEVFRHDMADGFPLLTTKKMAVKSILVELEGFIKGITSKTWYKDRGCKIWNEWANPVAAKSLFDKSEPKGDVPYNEENRKQAQELCDDLGPIYGYQWRNFDSHYGKIDFFQCDWENCSNGIKGGSDQLKHIIDTLKTNPNDRRMVCSAWNPNQEYLMALPPCHFAWNVVVIGDRLNLVWHQRSIDTGRGLPYNIASYGMLMLLLCKESGIKPGILMGTLADCHIYEDQISGLEEQLTRNPYPLCNITVPDFGNKFSIFDWTHKDYVIENYVSHPKLELGKIAI